MNILIINNFDSFIYNLVNYICQILPNEQIIISDNKISIKKIPFIKSLNTEVAMAVYPTDFEVEVDTFDPNITITSYEWDFGDNSSIQTTTTNKITHTYNKLGSFSLRITVRNSIGLSSSRTFDISAVSPKSAVNILLSMKLDNLNNIKSQIQQFSQFQQNSLDFVLNLNEAETSLASIQQRNATAITDNDYIDIMKDLISVNIPGRVTEIDSAVSVPFFSKEDYVDLDILKQIGEGNYENNKEAYKEAVVAWNLENIDTVSYTHLTLPTN